MVQSRVDRQKVLEEAKKLLTPEVVARVDRLYHARMNSPQCLARMKASEDSELITGEEIRFNC